MAAPRRSPTNLGEYRSTCMCINSVNASMVTTLYDDFWGKGPRRIQVFTHSILAPRCTVINFKPNWAKSCISARNTSACHRFILDNFDELREPRSAGEQAERLQAARAPFIKCLGRPERAFEYLTNLLVQHSYWTGSNYYLELQSSKCLVLPLLHNADMKHELFPAKQNDKKLHIV